MNVVDQIGKLWSDFLAFLSTLVIPDWAALIGLLPLFVLIGLVGPLLSLAVLAWLGYGVTKPRTKVVYDEAHRGSRRATISGARSCPRASPTARATA